MYASRFHETCMRVSLPPHYRFFSFFCDAKVKTRVLKCESNPTPILLSIIGSMLITYKKNGQKMVNPKEQLFQFGVILLKKSVLKKQKTNKLNDYRSYLPIDDSAFYY